MAMGPTKMNPADDATRKSNNVPKSTDRWSIGPDFLKQPSETWPKPRALNKDDILGINELENRKTFVGVVNFKEIQIPTCVRLFRWHGLIK